ncbi:hypothetical protein A464_1 [Salmonella bongori N268-08]|uniref:Uncharacterized protein n=1 Tax=Salmonella bongori N268-08 TaxID=1197719 RepID=S5NA78_SALBN|nr:hypothetical protein A464_1 [Salmonella bongori N268-08]
MNKKRLRLVARGRNSVYWSKINMSPAVREQNAECDQFKKLLT